MRSDGHRKDYWIAVAAVMAVIFVLAGEPPPAINEAHYLVKAKNFWNSQWCQNDLFASSGKAHVVFNVVFGWPTIWFSLTATAWIGRVLGWLMISAGLVRLVGTVCRRSKFPVWFSSILVLFVWAVLTRHANLAGEWVIGGIEAKVPAYGLLLWGLADVVNLRFGKAWVAFGVAAAFHVLTGGWAVVAGAITWGLAWLLCRRRKLPGPSLGVRGLILGGLLSLFGLVPAIWLSAAADPEIAEQAAKIYTFDRISHHLHPQAFHDWWYIRFGLLLVSWAALMFIPRLANRRGNRAFPVPARTLSVFIAATLVIGCIGLFFGWVPLFSPRTVASLLRFYWFRLPDAMLPLGVAILVASVLGSRRTEKELAV
ncbi:MAG: hypothetical protein AAF664_20245, partial [Planctomycetota bacterium]